jgi:inorganic pyrophosphatase
VPRASWNTSSSSFHFEHYKDLEKGKRVKLVGWGHAKTAKEILMESVARYNTCDDKPKF